MFGSEPYLVETFVDVDKYRGTCYKAANRRYLGETRGFFKEGKAFVYHGHKKAVYTYLLNKGFPYLIDSCPRRCRTPKVRERVVNMQLARADWNPEILNEVGLDADQVAELGDMLNAFLDPFRECYQRSDQCRSGETSVKGLLSDLDRKSIEPIALRYGVGVRGMQLFMENSPFADARMLQTYKEELSSRVNDPEGMFSADSTEFVKKGKYSVAVARQYCGRLGKTENCQSVVFIGYASERGYGLVNYELFMPEKWFTDEYASLRKKCCVPNDVTFKTKPQMAGEMLKDGFDSGLFKASGSAATVSSAPTRHFWTTCQRNAGTSLISTLPPWYGEIDRR